MFYYKLNDNFRFVHNPKTALSIVKGQPSTLVSGTY